MCGIYGGLNGTRTSFTPRASHFLDRWYTGRVSNSVSPEYKSRTLRPEPSYWVTSSGIVILTSRFGLQDSRVFVTATMYWRIRDFVSNSRCVPMATLGIDSSGISPKLHHESWQVWKTCFYAVLSLAHTHTLSLLMQSCSKDITHYAHNLKEKLKVVCVCVCVWNKNRRRNPTVFLAYRHHLSWN